MRLIVCENCGKPYDFERDDFCPKCGAFNQPVKTWTTDSQGNIRRVDGINEKNHAGSFVHSEVHKEKRIRQAKGMDWNRNPPPRQPSPAKPPRPKPSNTLRVMKAIFILLCLLITASFLIPLIMTILRFGA